MKCSFRGGQLVMKIPRNASQWNMWTKGWAVKASGVHYNDWLALYVTLWIANIQTTKIRHISGRIYISVISYMSGTETGIEIWELLHCMPICRGANTSWSTGSRGATNTRRRPRNRYSRRPASRMPEEGFRRTDIEERQPRALIPVRIFILKN